MKKSRLYKITLAAVFLAVGIVLPFFTAQIKEIGDTLLPMHIPVMLCGLLCGAKYGLAVGLMVPFLRSFLFSMPPLFPNAVWMALELATYGFLIGFLYFKFKKRGTAGIYLSLITAMISGRIVWGIAKALLLLGSSQGFTFSAFIAGGLIDAIPGIVLQLVVIPIIMNIVNKNGGNKMESVSFHYGEGEITHNFEPNELTGVIESSINTYKPELSEEDLVRKAMENL